MAERIQARTLPGQGERHAAESLLPQVYDELRRLAAGQLSCESPQQTLQATALVHEAYLRLSEKCPGQFWDNTRHFVAAAAETMRRILVENARRKQRVKHGGQQQRQALEPERVPCNQREPSEILAIHEVLEDLKVDHPRIAKLVELRYFLGCTVKQAAQVLGIAPKTAEEDWTFGKAWMKRRWLREGLKSR